jgi:hypothetical protein
MKSWQVHQPSTRIYGPEWIGPKYNVSPSGWGLRELAAKKVHLPQLLWKSVFPPWTIKPDKSPPWTFKTVRFTSLTGYKRFLKAVLSFYFLFISAEHLKNHSKSQKNHKIENPILLDSTRVDLHSEHIIWYALIHFFVVALGLWFLYN